MIIKKLLIASLIALMTLIFSSANAQSSEQPKDWQPVANGPNMLNLRYKAVECNGKKQVHLSFYNEKTSEQNAYFDLEVTNNANGEKHVKTIQFNAAAQGAEKAQCTTDDSQSYLKVDLPANFDLSSLSVKSVLKQ